MTIGWFARNWFLLGLAAAGALAWLFPEWGARGGPLRPEWTGKGGVALIFLMQGLAMTPAALRSGATRWKLHTATQIFVFVGFPVAVIALDALFGNMIQPELRMGFLFLAVLPTTVSTCVVFTTVAGGNTAAALFNSALSNVAGVVITPIWAAALLSARGEAMPLGPLIGEIALLLIAPIAVGQALRPFVRRYWEPDRKLLSVLSNAIILFIVFAAFASSALSGAFEAVSPLALLFLAGGAGALFIAATAAAVGGARLLGFGPGDAKVLLFCGPQKTLAAGAPMAQVLFAGHASLGLILLPVIAYHAIQLVAGAAMAARLGRGAEH
jgi:solute carrier family 10 (sodium/bile acid cotransporter), member 7